MFSANLGEVTAFQCVGVACNGTSVAVKELFKQLQDGLNRYAVELKFNPLRVDGLINHYTYLAAKMIAPRLAAAVGGAALTLPTITLDPYTVAKNADVWVWALNLAKTGQRAPALNLRVDLPRKTAETRTNLPTKTADTNTNTNTSNGPDTDLDLVSTSPSFFTIKKAIVGVALLALIAGVYRWKKA